MTFCRREGGNRAAVRSPLLSIPSTPRLPDGLRFLLFGLPRQILRKLVGLAWRSDFKLAAQVSVREFDIRQAIARRAGNRLTDKDDLPLRARPHGVMDDVAFVIEIVGA